MDFTSSPKLSSVQLQILVPEADAVAALTAEEQIGGKTEELYSGIYNYIEKFLFASAKWIQNTSRCMTTNVHLKR